MSRREFWVCASIVWLAFGCDSTAPDAVRNEALSASTTPAVAPADAVPACVSAFTSKGAESVCASCACGRCGDYASVCAGDAKCLAAVMCEHANYCQGQECYCGNGIAATICAIAPRGPCRSQFDAAAGVSGWTRVKAVLASGNTSNSLVRAARVASCTLGDSCVTQCSTPGDACTFTDDACQDRYCSYDAAKETQRAASAATSATPRIDQVLVNGVLAWSSTNPSQVPAIKPRDRIALVGTGFGRGTDVDFAKIMIGNSRILETNLTMFEQKLDITTEVNYETTSVRSQWASDLVSWSDTRVDFYVPVHASRGPIRMQIQKRIGRNASLVRLGEAHEMVDAQTLRITDTSYPFTCDVVSELSNPVGSNAIPVTVTNGQFSSLVTLGRQIFWSYDFNIGLAHKLRGLDWEAIFGYRTTDPVSGQTADPARLFGAIRAVRGEVPNEAIDDVTFSPYPQKNPIPGLLAIGPQFTSGNTQGTGWVGFRYAHSNHPFNGPGDWIGFNCASCHGYRISYQKGAQTIARVFPGLPNPNWTMKWTLLGDFDGVHGSEPGPLWAPGDADVDKTALLYAMPPGAGEHTLVRMHEDGSSTANDYEFSPIAIPNVTNHMPIRRALSHSESYVGFEGSYIHSEEPDGALGSMDAANLQALTAYMTTLDQSDDDLRNVGLYRQLSANGQVASLAGSATEGAFVASGWQGYPGVVARVNAGKTSFTNQCASCHSDALGANTNERMIRLDQVGRFFAPTVYQREAQAIRVGYLRDLYWVQHRGLLSDGHVRNLSDLVHPDRCTEGSGLYNAYYTLHTPNDPGSPGPDFPGLAPGQSPRGDVFRVARATGTDATSLARNAFVERHPYFVTQASDPTHYYWDYQRMRREYGPRELGTARPIGLPAAPHPWCAGSASEVQDLVLYLLTL